MTSTRALFAVRIGAEAWQEELITECPERIPAARLWAEQNGFDRFRIVSIDLDTPPDFAATATTEHVTRD